MLLIVTKYLYWGAVLCYRTVR